MSFDNKQAVAVAVVVAVAAAVAAVAVVAERAHRPGQGMALHGTAKVGNSWYLRERPRWCCCGSR